MEESAVNHAPRTTWADAAVGLGIFSAHSRSRSTLPTASVEFFNKASMYVCTLTLKEPMSAAAIRGEGVLFFRSEDDKEKGNSSSRNIISFRRDIELRQYHRDDDLMTTRF